MDNDTFNIAVTAKMRHGELWKLVEKFGSQKALARKLGVCYPELCAWINMTRAPKLHGEKADELERKLMELSGKTLEAFWPEVARSPEWLAMKKNTCAYRAFNPQFLLATVRERLTLPSPADEVAEHEIRESIGEWIHEAIATLPERQRFIIKLRWGIDCDRIHTYEEIGKHLKLTRERVRQIEVRAILRMQRCKTPGKMSEILGYKEPA